MKNICAVYLCLIALNCCSSINAQESRGSILGRVTDSSEAVVTGASVSALNVATNAAVSGATNQQGNFEIPYLLPGIYTVAVEAPGFSKAVREGIELRVSDRLTLNFALTVGGVAESVVVTGETPLLETSSASLGQVVDERRIRELPIVGGNAFYLTRITPGVTATGGHTAGNPMDHGIATGTVVNGTRSSSSEVTLDGAPNMQEGNAAFAPPQDMVQEFRVQTTSYDATLGHAAGAVVNVSLKSGTNQLHGTGYYFDSRIRAVPWFSNNFLYDPTTGPITEEKRRIANPGWLHQRWGATMSGPIRVPKLYDGRNRSFWTFGYEGLRIDRQPTFQATVPTQAQRNGDFSALLALGPQYQIYDPGTIQPASGGRFSRQPLPGNIIPPNRIDPVARNLLSYYPLPNASGTADGRQNFFGVQREPKDYKGFVGRIDHNFSDKHRFFGRLNSADYYTLLQTLPTVAVGNITLQRNYGAMLDDVYVFSPSLLLNVRGSITFFRNLVSRESQGFDLASLGLPASLIGEIQTENQAAGIAFPQVLPDFTSDNNAQYTPLGLDGGTRRVTNYSNVMGVVTKLAGSHSLRFGSDFRVLRETGFGYGNVAPRYEFNSTWTRGPFNNSPNAPLGQGLASMLFGLPSGGRINNNASRAQQSLFSAVFLQDDWKLTPRLTLNLGLRYEYESPITERYNRSISNFDFATPSPISAQALANYARMPIEQRPVSAFSTLGGLVFPGVDGTARELWQADKNNFGPRIGLALQISKRTVLRVGYGFFYDLLGADQRDVNQGGFNQPTNLIASLDNGLNFRSTVSDPFPGGIETPPGASGGLRTFLGRGLTAFNASPLNAYMQRWSFSVQHELPGRLLADVTYVGNRGNKLAVDRNLNAVLRQYLSTSPVRDQVTIDTLGRQTPNPFASIPDFAGTPLGNVNLAVSQLLRPLPHFQDITVSQSIGYSWYHSLQVSAQKRLSKGFTFQLAYTWSKFMEARDFLNDTDARPEHVISDQDFPHRLTVSGIYELPIGRGKPLLSQGNHWLEALFGGWQVQGWYEGQSGQALGFGNVSFYGDLAAIPLPRSERTPDRWFNVDAGFERNNSQALANNIRTLSTRFTGVRSDGINNLDASLFKSFQIREGYRLQLRMESFNALNHPQFGNPNTTPTNSAFGTVTAEKGHGQRQLTFALKFLF